MGCCHHGLDLELVPRLGAAASNCVRPDQRTTLLSYSGRARFMGPRITRRRGVTGSVVELCPPEADAINRVQAVARIPLIAAVTEHGSLLSLSATLSPARLAAAHFRCQHTAYPLDEQCHLVRDQAHVTIRRRKHGEARAIANRHDD